jgi:hypothetical protein
MNKKKLAVLSTVYAIAIVLISISFWQAMVQPALQNIMQIIPQTRSLLGVWFRFPRNSTYQYGFVSSNITQVTFKLPPNSHTQFSYVIESLGTTPLHNVSLYFDMVSERLALLGLANQSYPLPFEINIGTMEPNSSRDYGAIIETPAKEGTYEMQWHVNSSEIAFSFKIIINVAND